MHKSGDTEVARTDRFVAAVSHELRTPLTAIVGLAAELKENRGYLNSDEIDEFLTLIAEQSMEMARLVDDLLISAKADHGTLALFPQPVDLKAQLTAAANGIRFTVGDGMPPIFGNSPLAWADPLRVRQVVRNLLTNAARYGGPRVWVELAEGDDVVQLVVVDNGTGVPVDSEHEIFEAYRSAHREVPVGSVGLGLNLSRQLARLMGGDLSYRRRAETTRFELTLPLAT